MSPQDTGDVGVAEPRGGTCACCAACPGGNGSCTAFPELETLSPAVPRGTQQDGVMPGAEDAARAGSSGCSCSSGSPGQEAVSWL